MYSIDTGGSGIEGQTILGPISPIERPGMINYRPYQATASIVDQRGQTVAKLQSDAKGRFRIPLKPGRYILYPESLGSLPWAMEQSVVVSEGQFTEVRITYDSGIR